LGSIIVVLTATTILFVDIIFVNGMPNYAIWIIIAVSIVLGLIIGYFLVKAQQVFFIILGAYIGYIVAILLYNMFLHNINGDQNTIYWTTCGVSAAVFAIAAYVMYQYIVIFSTSLIGAYATIRGISMYAGGFPDESLVITLIKNNETSQLDTIFTWRVYLYLASIILLFIIGVIFQANYHKKEEEREQQQGGFYHRNA